MAADHAAARADEAEILIDFVCPDDHFSPITVVRRIGNNLCSGADIGARGVADGGVLALVIAAHQYRAAPARTGNVDPGVADQTYAIAEEPNGATGLSRFRSRCIDHPGYEQRPLAAGIEFDLTAAHRENEAVVHDARSLETDRAVGVVDDAGRQDADAIPRLQIDRGVVRRDRLCHVEPTGTGHQGAGPKINRPAEIHGVGLTALNHEARIERAVESAHVDRSARRPARPARSDRQRHARISKDNRGAQIGYQRGAVIASRRVVRQRQRGPWRGELERLRIGGHFIDKGLNAREQDAGDRAARAHVDLTIGLTVKGVADRVHHTTCQHERAVPRLSPVIFQGLRERAGGEIDDQRCTTLRIIDNNPLPGHRRE